MYCVGSCSEFVKCPGEDVALKPPSLSFTDAASIPLAAMTALQALRRYDGDLAGKTVLIPAGCTYYVAQAILFTITNYDAVITSGWNGVVCLPVG